MKNILIFLVVCIVAFSSCKRDPLDITPDGRMSLEDIFANEIQTEAYLNTVYSSIPTYFKGYNQWSFLAGMTDEAQDAEVGNNPNNVSAQWATGVLTPSYNPMALAGNGNGNDRYTTFWKGIYDANVFLQHIDKVNFVNPARKSRLKAEAILLRSFFYFELVKQFGPLPILKEPLSNTFDYKTLTRPSFQEVIDFVVQECNQTIAEPNFPLRIIVETERGRFSKAVAYALKSQALLYNASPLWNPGNESAKWDAAAVAAKEALNILTANGNFILANDYSDYFLNTADLNASPRDRETIFEGKSGEIPLSTIGIPSKVGSWMLGATPSQELVDSYEMKATGEPAILGYNDADHLSPIINAASGYDASNPYVGRDPRFYATVWYNGALYDNINGAVHTIQTYVGGSDQLIKTPPNRTNTHTGYYTRKFVDPTLPVNGNSSAKWKKYRLAEIYLNLAEARNEASGPVAEVYDAINAIRRRVDMPDLPTGLNQTQMRERIRRERRVELVWEEHRFWDVRRWKILGETDRLVTGMEIKMHSSGGSAEVKNAGFELSGANWSMNGGATTSTTAAYEGTRAADIIGAAGGILSQTITVKPNTTYTLTAWIRTTAGSGYIGVNSYGAVELSVVHSGATWTQKIITFKTGISNTTAVIYSWWPGGGLGQVDNFEVKQVGDTRSFTYERFVTERRNSYADKYLIFPIPLFDASIVPDFNINQNPGW
jgi:hypothetical protein